MKLPHSASGSCGATSAIANGCGIFLITLFLSAARLFALGQPAIIETIPDPGSFPITQGKTVAAIDVDSNDFSGVWRAAHDLALDVSRVCGLTPAFGQGSNTIVIGSIGKSRLIDNLIAEHKIDAAPIAGKWESYLIQVVSNPAPGIDRALVVAGSDKRGAIYGIYELSEQMGVSPWYWWADVPVKHQANLFAKAGPFVQGPPSVKYRGIFLNDEAPDLTEWVAAKYGYAPNAGEGVANYGRGFYTNLFELILRLKGNYLWPAMWNNAFSEDDPENPRLADEYGIVMGTSHQEPMLRAQKEWDRDPRYGKRYHNWNYSVPKQQPVLREFWREGVRRNKDFESIFTLGLRAENDTGKPIGQELTGEIVKVQRGILAGEINPDLTKIPQLWCLYKEVQGFYDAGMNVPDDVTLLWTDDNWGGLRRVPTAAERRRSGGAGIYYHFDYHGPPRSYQWINTTPLSKIWDQMSLAKEYGADRIWIVNVGHFKGYEFPIEYFLNLAWDAGRWTNNSTDDFTRLWAAREFGPEFAGEIADLVTESTKYAGRIKPELLEPDTFSFNYDEFERVTAEYESVNHRAQLVLENLPADKRAAFTEFVLFPAQAAAQLYELYFAAARNAREAAHGWAVANDDAAQVRSLFEAHTNLMNYFNHTLTGGKWDHFMDQPVLGYTNWRDPANDSLRAIPLREIVVPAVAAMDVAPEGRTTLPVFNGFERRPRHFIDIFNRGSVPFDFQARSSAKWLRLSETNGTVAKEHRLWITADSYRAPVGSANETIQISGAGTNYVLPVQWFNPTNQLHGFIESDGVVSIEADHFTKKTDTTVRRWRRIQNYGPEDSGMRAEAPVDSAPAVPGQDSPSLEYAFHCFDAGDVNLTVKTSPSLNMIPGRSVSLAVSLDDEPAKSITVVPADYVGLNGHKDWENAAKQNAHFARARLTVARPGPHILKLWMIDPTLVAEKLVLDFGGLKPSFLGPPESPFAPMFDSAEDWSRTMQALHLPAPPVLPPSATDPNRPARTRPVGGGSPNWTDGNPGHTIVRSGWGRWANYDEDKASVGPLPDPLLLKNGDRVTDAETWWTRRRPEILRDFNSEIYGRIPSGLPEVRWRVSVSRTNGLTVKKITGSIDNDAYPLANPGIQLTLYLPPKNSGPVPAIVTVGPGFSFGPPNASPSGMDEVLGAGWAYATFNTDSVQADSGAGLTLGIIGLMNRGQPRTPDQWGVLAAWSWGLSRALDYLESDPDIDAHHLGIEGHSRWGKTALLAAAMDPRWAIAYASCSGAGGAKLYRHEFGETLDNIAGTGAYHWMAGNFLRYAGHWNSLPVDQHELIALVAPRPIFVTGGTQDLWADPTGEFQACVAAGPVYRLLGKKDLGTATLPAPDAALVDGDVAFRLHAGGHTDRPDWPVFISFAKKYFPGK